MATQRNEGKGRTFYRCRRACATGVCCLCLRLFTVTEGFGDETDFRSISSVPAARRCRDLSICPPRVDLVARSDHANDAGAVAQLAAVETSHARHRDRRRGLRLVSRGQTTLGGGRAGPGVVRQLPWRTRGHVAPDLDRWGSRA